MLQINLINLPTVSLATVHILSMSSHLLQGILLKNSPKIWIPANILIRASQSRHALKRPTFSMARNGTTFDTSLCQCCPSLVIIDKNTKFCLNSNDNLIICSIYNKIVDSHTIQTFMCVKMSVFSSGMIK